MLLCILGIMNRVVSALVWYDNNLEQASTVHVPVSSVQNSVCLVVRDDLTCSDKCDLLFI